MNSKECLENIKHAPGFMGGNSRYKSVLESRIPFLEDIEIIKQDLDKLEKLEKENQELKEQNINLREENINLKKVIEKIKSLPNCDICDANWHKGCMCLQNKLKKALLIDNFENMFINCKLTPLPELEELQDDK